MLHLVSLLWLAGSAYAGTVSLKTTDGVSLKATTWGSGEHGVLLVHEAEGDSTGWTAFAERLSTNGFNVIAVDLRGHGASGGNLSEDDYPKMVADLDASITWLQGHGAKDIAIVGAELGANLALVATAANKDVTTLAMISPALNAHGVRVSAGLAGLDRRPVLLVASEDDMGSARAASLIEGKAQGSKHLQLYPGSAAGCRMFNTAPELEGLLISWLNGSFLQSTDPQAATSAEVKTEVDDIQTTGKRLGE